MSALDEEFYETLRNMELLAAESLLNDTFPPANSHNTSARILRLGLAVTAFSLLERYIAEKFSELLADISSCPVPYSSFPEKLKSFITLHAVSGLANRASFLEKADALAFVEAGLSRISAFGASPSSYTAFGFSPRGSNVGEKDIENGFSAMGVGAVWATLSAITHEIGGGRVSLQQDFRNLARTRHRSAHSPSHNVPTADILTHIQTARIVGVAVCILISVVGRSFLNASNFAQLRSLLASLDRNYRFLDEEPQGTWIERTETAGRPIKRYADQGSAVSGARQRTGSRLIVLRNTRLVPVAIA